MVTVGFGSTLSETTGVPKYTGVLSAIASEVTFAGAVIKGASVSGTTGAVAHKMNRNYILVEQMDYVHDLPEARLKKVIGGEQGGISKSVNWQGGGDFIYCELMKYNESYIEKIQVTKTPKELVNLWKDIAENSFLNWYVNPEIPDDAVNNFIQIGKKENGLYKQKKLLIELLDKNQLYVNLSEIDDEDFCVSEDDKNLNRSFYGENYNG